MVFFSEKVYWYPQGYAILELILFYAAPIYACFWVIDEFRVQQVAPLLLVASLYAFLVEGVLTPVMYEAGLADPFMPAYFVGWHGLLSFYFGWYLVRKWLVNQQWRRLLLGALLAGLFWGGWALTYDLPEHSNDFPRPGPWSVPEFGLHALTFSAIFLAGHWALGRWGWQTCFRPGRAERWVLSGVLLFLWATMSLPGAPLGFLKLGVLLILVWLPLRRSARRNPDGSVFSHLSGGVRVRHLAVLLAMPGMAIAVYALARWKPPGETLIRTFLEMAPALQTLAGGVAFLWAWGATAFRSGSPNSPASGSGVRHVAPTPSGQEGLLMRNTPWIRNRLPRAEKV